MKLFKQRAVKLNKFSMIVGGTMNTYSQMSVPLSMVNFLMLAGVFYATVIEKTPWLAWIDLWLFVILFISGIFTAGLVIWTIILPHTIAYTNYMNYKHDSPMAQDLKKIKEKLEVEG